MVNNNLNDIVVGIDHGFKNMKTAHCCFPTALSSLSVLPDNLKGVLQFNGNIYKENGEKLNYVDNTDKTKNNDFYLLTLFSLAKELRERGLTSANVTLATGLPQRWYERQKKDFHNYLSKYKEINFKYEGTAYHLYLNGVNVYTQGYAAFMTSSKIMDYISKEVCVVDIGGGTVDYIRVINGSIATAGPEGSKIDTRASLWLINQIQEQVETELCTTIPESTIINYMQTGSKEQKAQNQYEEIMQREFKNYSDMIFTKLKEYRINVDLIPVIFIGGGATIIQNFGTYNSTTDFITDIKANAIGYEKIMNLLS